MSKRLLVVLIAFVVALAAILVVVAAGSGSDGPDGLPEVDSTEAPTSYRIAYDVITPDGRTSEELIVHRPFLAHVIERDHAGEVTAERWSDLGTVITKTGDDDPVRLDTAVAPAGGDLRPDRFAARLVEADRVVAGADEAVAGRSCRRYEADASVPTAGAGEETPSGRVPVTIERCIDEVGLVLEERWTTPAGERVLTKRATELEVGDGVPDVDLPDAAPLSAAQGNGSFEEVDAHAPTVTASPLTLPDPDGFTFVGRFEVTAPQLGGSATAAAVTLTTDVWRRGGDLLVLDQAVSPDGRTPFDPTTELEPLELPGLGAAALAADLRAAEVRLVRPDGFVRLSGTIPLDELVELARTIAVPTG